MGDHVVVKKVDFLGGHKFRIELFNETQNKTEMVFIDKDELYSMLEKAMKQGVIPHDLPNSRPKTPIHGA